MNSSLSGCIMGRRPLNLFAKKLLFLIFLTSISIGALLFVYRNVAGGNIPELDLDVRNSLVFPSNIYLVETSGASKLNPRQACAVESVARCHQLSIIHVYLLESKKFEDNFSLLSLSNVRFIKIDRKDFFRGTPLWSWYEKSNWQSSTNKYFEMSDACRYVMVWKFGGFYLDLDIVTLRPLYGFENENSLVRESNGIISSAVFGFQRHHGFISMCLEKFKTNYNKALWGCVGPKLITKVFKSYCNTQKVKDGRHSGCDVTVLPPQVAYPSPYYEWKDYFDPAKKEHLSRLANSSYLAHLWNFFSKDRSLSLNSGSYYEELIKDKCPFVYRNLVKWTEANSSFLF